jgi:hypothetical protein
LASTDVQDVGVHPQQKQTKGETEMLRKTLIAVAAVAALGTVALAPTSASAGKFGFHHHHHHHGHFHGFGWGFAPSYVVSNCYLTKKPTPFGWRVVKVCEY